MITQEILKNNLDYDSETGIFKWKISKKGLALNSIAGSRKGVYVIIGIEKEYFYAHRLAWLYVTGEWPINLIDHVDGNKKNNCFKNLRQADKAENSRNKGLQKNNKSGCVGVSRFRNKWQVQLRVNGQRVHLGHYANLEDAKKVSINFRKSNYGKFYKEVH